MDSAMEDVTMDIDIDLGDGEILDEPEPEPVQQTTLAAPELVSDHNIPQESPAPEPGNDQELVPNKVHIRGVDDLSTANLEAFAAEHFDGAGKTSVEWIDDTSANFVFENEERARRALAAFTSLAAGNADALHPLQLREARPLAAHPAARLQVRGAVVTDKKKPRAREASRYYLMHPEEDPAENRRSSNNQGSRYRQRRRRNSDDEVEKFDASMYDDDEAALANRRRRGSGDENDGRDGHGASRRGRRNNTRDRSASPLRAGSRTDYGRRDRDLFDKSRDIGPLLRGNAAKELFPTATKTANNKNSASSLKQELFPNRTGADKAADLFSSKIAISRGARDTAEANADDSDRAPPLRSDALYAEQKEKQRQNQAKSFNIRGAAGANGGDQGFSIRGSAGQKKSIRELFPESSGSGGGGGANAGKELFGGRAARRNKAADLFG